MCILFQYQIPCQPLGLYKKPALRPRWMSQKWTKSGFCRAGFDCVSGHTLNLVVLLSRWRLKLKIHALYVIV